MDKKLKTAESIPPRLYGLLARDARVGVIFRRGPSKRVQLTRWNLENDELEHGQWFKGRIHENWCDLSPSGKLLIYFAATYRWPYATWTAISTPPYLTALALWPQGDTWYGGGRFISDTKFYLAHPPETSELAPGYKLAPGMEKGFLSELPETSWICVQKGQEHVHRDANGYCFYYEYNPPKIKEKINCNGYRLQRIHTWSFRLQKVSYDYRVIDDQGDILIDLLDTCWADWDQGDLVFAKNGCLYRLSCDEKGNLQAKEKQFFQLIYNFRKNSFRPLKAPPEACCW